MTVAKDTDWRRLLPAVVAHRGELPSVSLNSKSRNQAPTNGNTVRYVGRLQMEAMVVLLGECGIADALVQRGADLQTRIGVFSSVENARR